MTNNLLKALYLDWFEKGPLKDSFFEVRHVPCPNPKQVAYPRFYCRPSSPAQWNRHHLFFGVNPRSSNRDSKTVSNIVALFADIDRNGPETMLQIRDFQPRISALVSSGRGLHAYWFLGDPIPASLAGNVSCILRGISRRLNADPAVVSPNQLLRIPGSTNPKNNAACSEIFVDGKIRYSIDEFSEFKDPMSQQFSKGIARPSDLPLNPGNHLPRRFIRDLGRNLSLNRIWSTQPLPEFRSGSERDFALCMKLAWRDYTPDEIATILFCAPYPKTYPRSLHYLSSTVWKASTHVEQAKLKWTRLRPPIRKFMLNRCCAHFSDFPTTVTHRWRPRRSTTTLFHLRRSPSECIPVKFNFSNL